MLFDKSRDCVVMLISGLIVAYHPFLDTFRGSGKINMNLAVHTRICCENAKFYGIQSCTGIASEISAGILLLLRPERYQNCQVPYFYRSPHVPEVFDIFFFQRFQFKNNGAGNQSAVHFKIWVFRSSSIRMMVPSSTKGRR